MDLEFPTDSAAFHVMPSIHFQIASEEQGGSSRKRTTFGPKVGTNRFRTALQKDLRSHTRHLERARYSIHVTWTYCL